MRKLMAALLLAHACAAQAQYSGIPLTQLIPAIDADGTHRWTVVIAIDKTFKKIFDGDASAKESHIANEVAKVMGSARFCERGWIVDSRMETPVGVTVMGKCRT
jgi:hypothetical protein